MPQFDTSTYLSQIVWLVLCFGIVIFLIKFIFVPNIFKIKNERFLYVQHFIQQTEEYKKKRDFFVQKREQQVERVQNEIDEKYKELVINWRDKKEKTIAEWKHDKTQYLNSVKQSFEKEKKQYKKEVTPIINKLTKEILSKWFVK
ncbi:MAG: F0F1 ATP synthase subunit B family protein [Alphaproteobacteria bacterium]